MFLMVKPLDITSDDGPDSTPKINIAQNWHQELLERVPVD